MSQQFDVTLQFAGYAPLFGAWGGLGWLSGYADGPPVEMRHVMDHSVGLHAAMAVVAALHRRRRTGQGSHVDLAAREVAQERLLRHALRVLADGVVGLRPVDGQTQLAPQGLKQLLAVFERFIKIPLGQPGLQADVAYGHGKKSLGAVQLQRGLQQQLTALGLPLGQAQAPEIAPGPGLGG